MPANHTPRAKSYGGFANRVKLAQLPQLDLIGNS